MLDYLQINKLAILVLLMMGFAVNAQSDLPLVQNQENNTDCVFELPFYENFNATTTPLCWEEVHVEGGLNTLQFAYGSSNSHSPAISEPYEGENMLIYKSGYTQPNVRQRLQSPAISTLGISDIIVEFMFYHSNANPTIQDRLQVQYSLDGTDWIDVGEEIIRANHPADEGWYLKSIALPEEVNNQDEIYVGLYFKSAFGWNMFVDQLKVHTSSVEVESVVVTTENDVAAEINQANGTLQLIANVLPTDALQDVNWSITSDDDVVSVDENGLVTAIANGTAIVKATSILNENVFGEIEINVNIAEDDDCPTVESFLFTFDDFTTFPEQCWSASVDNAIMTSIVGEDDKALQVYSFFSTDDIYIVSPPVSTINGQYFLTFDVEAFNDDAMIQIGSLSDPTDYSDFSAVADPFVPQAGETYISDALPTIDGHKYVAIRFIPNSAHRSITIDNVEWNTSLNTVEIDKNHVKLYPNPTQGIVNINTDLDLEKVEVYNTLGQNVFVGKVINNTFDLSTQPKGVYIVRLQTTDGQIMSYKLIKK